MGILKSLQEIEAYFRQEYDNTGSRKFKRYANDLRLAQVMLTPEAYFDETKKSDIVRCKDCKHKPMWNNDVIEFPDTVCRYRDLEDEEFNEIPNDNWFCADGKRMDQEHSKKLVRCKDCKHCYYASNRIEEEQSYTCNKHGFDVTPDYYCANGERG